MLFLYFHILVAFSYSVWRLFVKLFQNLFQFIKFLIEKNKYKLLKKKTSFILCFNMKIIDLFITRLLLYL